MYVWLHGIWTTVFKICDEKCGSLIMCVVMLNTYSNSVIFKKQNLRNNSICLVVLQRWHLIKDTKLFKCVKLNCRLWNTSCTFQVSVTTVLVDQAFGGWRGGVYNLCQATFTCCYGIQSPIKCHITFIIQLHIINFVFVNIKFLRMKNLS
jgi:hypothetical protein